MKQKSLQKELDAKFGIKGANPGCFILAKDERYCDICFMYIPYANSKDDKLGELDTLKMFHYIGYFNVKLNNGKYITRMKNHIAVCNECFSKIPDGYYGCGCGG